MKQKHNKDKDDGHDTISIRMLKLCGASLF